MYELLTLTFSFLLAVMIIPSIIHVANTRHLYDEPAHPLKIHTHPVPRLGGIAIFLSFILTLLIWGFNHPLLQINYLIAACMILFALGLKDDLTGVGHYAKFSVELIVAMLLTIPGDIRLYNLYGLFDIYELPYCSSILLSVLILIFIVNAFNLIDGIDGLAAAIGMLVHLTFAALFIYIRQFELATVCLSLAGALIGFLKFNLTPARLFMGDTGSLLIGLISAVMALKFIEVSAFSSAVSPSSAMAICLAILIVPVSDTLSVFIIRIVKGKSPFQGDLHHIHHKILRQGFTHLQTTAILLLVNGLIILVFLFKLIE
jgi:UDP-GlcNAc:undecaprenyl-phosphate GlcNAc-1-phosphate transferase